VLDEGHQNENGKIIDELITELNRVSSIYVNEKYINNPILNSEKNQSQLSSESNLNIHTYSFTYVSLFSFNYHKTFYLAQVPFSEKHNTLIYAFISGNK